MGEILDVGPKDVDSAGDMVSKVGVHNQAKRLIQAVRENYPAELVAALARPEDQGRTKMLDADEVESIVDDAGWEDVTEILSARVYGEGKQSYVGILFATESGRSARGAIPYENFPTSEAAYDRAVTEGGVVVTDEDDPKQLRRALEAAEKQLSEGAGPDEDEIRERVRAEASDEIREAVKVELQEAGLLDEEGNPVVKEPYEGYSEAGVPDVVAKLPELNLSELVALQAAENDREEPRKGVIEPLTERLDAAQAALSGSSTEG